MPGAARTVVRRACIARKLRRIMSLELCAPVPSRISPKNPDLQRVLDLCPSTPALLLDPAVVEADFRDFSDAFAGTRIFYAIKANPHPEILKRLFALGCGFEVSSVGELRMLQALGIPGDRIISSNPVKTEEFVREAAAHGVGHFAFDSAAEVEKLARHAPGTAVSVRLTVPNEGSDWPLDKKYGVEDAQAVDLLAAARERGLRPAGITFHVGSQNRNANGWRVALEKTRVVWEMAERRGLRLTLLNVGGGMPVEYNIPNVPDAHAVARAIFDARKRLFPSGVETWLEPGRALVGRAGVMVCTVIGVAERDGERWVYLDAGIFHGLAEAMGGITYRALTQAKGPVTPCTLAGPSCDSVDTISKEFPLPPVRVGDRVALVACGAYTTAYSSVFNGFPGPEAVIAEGALI
ncbi:MAG: type III PLP-dependent enzyme [Dehalococcoidia bacterium]|nr:type III PLP-dependent enzyme [Dehalococcoidia bacterium]